MRQQIQKFGRALSGMVMPNIGAFIAWGFVTALFIPSGWWPNTQMARLVDPMLTYLLPLLIAYTAGRNVAGERGGVIGAIAAMGVIVGSDIPMFIGAMVMGPLGGYTIRWFDKLTQGRIKAGFEMLVSNFSIGILGMLLAILGYWVIGGAVTGLTLLVSNGVEVVIRHGLLPLVSLLVEPSKVLFLNNALNHGIFSPIGIEQARETGQSIMFLLETNPGPGLGVLLACWFFGRGNMRQSAPGAVIIQFCGGIHEIYFPYILARPALILAPGLIEPGVVDGIVSQIDLMPTLLSLLNMSYDSHFYGRSIFDPAYVNRAFIATYQDLGYLEGDTFTILSPVRRFEQYRVVPTEENPHHLEAMERKDAVQVDRAIGYYQTSCKWNKR